MYLEEKGTLETIIEFIKSAPQTLREFLDVIATAPWPEPVSIWLVTLAVVLVAVLALCFKLLSLLGDLIEKARGAQAAVAETCSPTCPNRVQPSG